MDPRGSKRFWPEHYCDAVHLNQPNHARHHQWLRPEPQLELRLT